MEKDLELVSREVSSDDLYLKLSGLLITEELDMLIKLCTREVSYNSLPLYVEIDNSKERVGELDVNLDTLLLIYALSPDYTLSIVDEEINQTKVIFSPENKLSGNELVKFISL